MQKRATNRLAIGLGYIVSMVIFAAKQSRKCSNLYKEDKLALSFYINLI